MITQEDGSFGQRRFSFCRYLCCPCDLGVGPVPATFLGVTAHYNPLVINTPSPEPVCDRLPQSRQR
jgi:hypothetical protein